jgi:hypothetical protein
LWLAGATAAFDPAFAASRETDLFDFRRNSVAAASGVGYFVEIGLNRIDPIYAD